LTIDLGLEIPDRLLDGLSQFECVGFGVVFVHRDHLGGGGGFAPPLLVRS
jgi:hypothetical protein